MYSYLSKIDSPDDLKALSIPELAKLSREMREFIIETVSETGGHLAPSLGVVEMTIVLHYLFDKKDRIVWDVGHQCYPHKILTGRRDAFKTLRQHQGLSGFPKLTESEYDAFGVGHASTSISAALGMVCARDLRGEDNQIIAVIGDGALTGGLAYEGLNNAGANGKNLIVILNDNSMSISPNVGAMAKYLTTIISNPLYNKIKSDIWNFTGKFDRMGQRIRWAARRMEESMKNFILPGLLFERLGFRYFGPVDGHNISSLLKLLQEVKALNGPILVHVLTKKGKGFKPAEDNASAFHGLGKFNPKTGKVIKSNFVPTYTQVFGTTLTQLAGKNEKLVAITAAMQLGTGLNEFAQKYPQRFFDVGIAEGHALTFAAGLAVGGFRPVVALYSSFLQRSYDQIVHDVALQNLPVIFAIDRAGLVGDDGPTHHGVFDISFLSAIPNMVLMVPRDEEELRHMLYTAINYTKGPIAVRYPRGIGEGVTLSDDFDALEIGKSKTLLDGQDVAILALGPMNQHALKVAHQLQEEDHITVKVVNARFAKPLDHEMLSDVFSRFKLVVTLEEGVLSGGFGSQVALALTEHPQSGVELIRCGIPDKFIDQGNKELLLDDVGLGVPRIADTIRNSKVYQSIHRKVKITHFLRSKKEAKAL
ncbi:1-deoxy-D-xylulose-5-phosphate synthase [candidate division KSB1 bacterium]|nr:1-deoxy-D-xylulose-5-phosphate synthase [candidate division KSB1 bacterium]